MAVSDEKYKEISRNCFPLKTLAHSQTNLLLLLRYKYNFGLLKSTGFWGDLYVFRTSAEILPRSFITGISKKRRARSTRVCWDKMSHNCSHTWMIRLAPIFSCQHQTMRAANKSQPLRKWTLTSAFLNLSLVLILQGPVNAELSLQHFPQ